MGQVVTAASAESVGPDRLPGIQQLWAESQGDNSICIAVLDGPADLAHPCFQGADLEVVAAAVSRNGCAASRHGTHVASILFGQPNSPIHGLAPNCHGLIIPVFAENADGSIQPCSQLELGRAIALAVGRGARVVNISGGQLEPTGKAHPALDAAVRLCAENDVLIVAAAGNEGCECLHVPAALSSVLVVGAMDLEGRPLPFSNWSPSYRATGILALGENVLGAVPAGGTGTFSGTSCATPIVSGVAALLLSIQRQRGIPLNVHAVRDAIINTAVDCDQLPSSDCRRLLAGRLNIPAALNQIMKGAEPQMSDTMNPVDARSEGTPFSPASSASPPSPAVTAAVVSSTPSQPSTVTNEAPVAPSANGRRPAAVKSSAEVYASACGCGCQGPRAASLVYALGQLDYDFGTESNRDYFVQHTPDEVHPLVPEQFAGHLQARPYDATAVHWLLCQQGTPIYAIKPAGPFAAETYSRLRDYFQEQIENAIDRVSIPGLLDGTARLLNGQEVPVIVPDIRGMFNWTTAALIRELIGNPPEGYPEDESTVDEDSPPLHQNYKRLHTEIRKFLERVYFETRNFGLAPQERAINYAVTNAFQVADVFKSEMGSGYKLAGIDTEQSPICRPGTDCWDVRLSFFNPPKRFEVARKVFRFTVDVSEVIPVTVGQLRHWEEF